MLCPVCKADNSQGPACRRCKADLSVLWELERRRETLLCSARQKIATQINVAIDDAAEANRLHAGADAERLLALARLLARDFTGALQAYQHVKASERS